MQKNTQQAIPFPLEGNTASREVIRDSSKNVDHLRKILLEKIQIRPGFNPRRQNGVSEDAWEIILGIPSLADGIYASNGPNDPILGDIHSDGTFYITEGERRTRALRHLMRTDREIYPNGQRVCEVTILLNPPKTTDLERKRRALSADNKLKLKAMDRAYYYLSFKTENDMSNEQIAKFLGISRQSVDMYILATELPEEQQEEIDNGSLKISTAIAAYREENKKNKKGAAGDEDEPLIPVEKREEEKKGDGDEEEFLSQEDNSISSPGSRGGPREESGKVISGKDSIYKDQEDTARWKQFLNRLQVITTECADTTGGEEEATRNKVIERLKGEFVLQLK